MFRPPSLLSPQIVPTAAHTAAGQPGILRPGLSCFVASTRTGYANRPNTGIGRDRDFHPVSLSALSAAHFTATDFHHLPPADLPGAPQLNTWPVVSPVK